MSSISAFSFLFAALYLLTMASAATFDIRTTVLTLFGLLQSLVVVDVSNLVNFGRSTTPLARRKPAFGHQFANQDFFDVSNIDGFNVPMEFSSNSPGCSGVIKCTADIVGQCPEALKVPGGCNGPCSVFKTEEHCCNSGDCGSTTFSRFFKERCPDAYSYPKDNSTSTFTCPTGTNYKVIFCPNVTPLGPPPPAFTCTLSLLG